MSRSVELPDCYYPVPPMTITPCAPTPNHTLYLTNLDDQMYLRFPANYVYVFQKSVEMDTMKSSLLRVIVDYYPFAGRFKTSTEDDNKLELDCNGEGVVFAEASMDITAKELFTASMMPNWSWKKFECQVESHLPLAIQVTNLRCGGMILCASISHILCDAGGASQFLNAWAQLTKNPNSNLTITPSHDRCILKNRDPPQVNFPHPVYIKTPTYPKQSLLMSFLSKPLVSTSFTFGVNEINCLKKQCTTSSFNKITTFEVVTAHTWRSFVKSGDLPLSQSLKLFFTFNVRKKMKLPEGYYGNGFVLVCAESTVKDLVSANNLDHCVKLVQQAEDSVDEEYVRSTIDLLKDKTVIPDRSLALIISQLRQLGFEDADFGEGKPLHVGVSGRNLLCTFSPVIGDPKAVRFCISLPKTMEGKFQHYMTEIESWDKYEYKMPIWARM